MGRIPKFSSEVKIKACKDYDKGKGSFASIADEVGCDSSVLITWYHKYLKHGDSAFEYSSKNKSYSSEFKLIVVKEYLAGVGSFVDLAIKYDIHHSVAERWVNMYNSGIELKDYNPRSEVYTMKHRKTSFEERLEIVNWVIDNEMNYKEGASKYMIPYASVYNWTKKYLNNGKDSIRNKKRGRKITHDIDLDNLSEVERLKHQLRLEMKKRERAEFELEVLKKKEQLERNQHYQKLGK